MSRTVTLENPQVQARYKGSIKLPRAGLKIVSIRGTKGYVFIEFESVNIPKIELEIANDD
jgi:hypothetical protein